MQQSAHRPLQFRPKHVDVDKPIRHIKRLYRRRGRYQVKRETAGEIRTDLPDVWLISAPNPEYPRTPAEVQEGLCQPLQ